MFRDLPGLCKQVLVKCPVWQSDNDLCNRKIFGIFPVEAVPTPDKILFLIPYFFENNRFKQEKNRAI